MGALIIYRDSLSSNLSLLAREGAPSEWLRGEEERSWLSGACSVIATAGTSVYLLLDEEAESERAHLARFKLFDWLQIGALFIVSCHFPFGSWRICCRHLGQPPVCSNAYGCLNYCWCQRGRVGVRGWLTDARAKGTASVFTLWLELNMHVHLSLYPLPYSVHFSDLISVSFKSQPLAALLADLPLWLEMTLYHLLSDSSFLPTLRYSDSNDNDGLRGLIR